VALAVLKERVRSGEIDHDQLDRRLQRLRSR
jgi:hypothetical protein